MLAAVLYNLLTRLDKSFDAYRAATDRLLDSHNQTGPIKIAAIHSNTEVSNSNNVPNIDNNEEHNANDTGRLYNNATYKNAKSTISTASTAIKVSPDKMTMLTVADHPTEVELPPPADNSHPAAHNNEPPPNTVNAPTVATKIQPPLSSAKWDLLCADVLQNAAYHYGNG